MSEQATCHEWDIEQERWMHNTLSGPEIILAGEWPCDCYCPTCGKKLNWDGSMTTMVPAVTPEAVGATRLYALLEAASSNLPQGSLPQGELDALVTLGLVDGSDPHAAVPLTEQGRTIHAAIQQARGLAAADEPEDDPFTVASMLGVLDDLPHTDNPEDRWQHWTYTYGPLAALITAKHLGYAEQNPDDEEWYATTPAGERWRTEQHAIADAIRLWASNATLEQCMAGVAKARAALAAGEPGEPTADEREPVRWFAGLMETTLRKHDAERGEYGWRDGCDEEYLVERLQDEVRELVREFNPCMLLTQAERVIAECADIGNFAMMLADQHRAIIAQRGGKE